MAKAIGILGGTFDPIHFGHLRTALELQQILNLSEIRFIPCQTPVHKATVYASAEDRLMMLKFATKIQDTFIVDPREINRSSPSYMFETLQSLREEFPDRPLLMLLGSDAFKDLPSWHQWEQLLDFCHIVVALRPGYRLNLSDDMQQYLKQNTLTDAKALEDEYHGGIYVQTITALDISATMIRTQISAGFSPRFLLPETVLAYIGAQKLYL